MSADWSETPEAVPYATLSNPQSLNLYAYVGNDPVSGMDADGHFTLSFGGWLDNGDGMMAYQDYQNLMRDASTPASKPASDNSHDPKCSCYIVRADPAPPPPLWKQFGSWIRRHPKPVKTPFGIFNTATDADILTLRLAMDPAIPEG